MHVTKSIISKKTKGAFGMKTKYTGLENHEVTVDFNNSLGEISYRDHSFGIGGINTLPMPDKVVSGIKKLKPKLIRIFIQEFFFIYPESGVFDWTKLDAYMDSVHAIGADIMAHITIKPKALYPVIDENIWQPTSVSEWQSVIEALVHRYSVEKKYVTHWAMGNEINIGELGGCPYKFTDPYEFFEYYQMTAHAIAKAYPQAKIGGMAWAGCWQDTVDFMTEFINHAVKANIKPDFVSYNIYEDCPHDQANAVERIRPIVEDLGVDMYITELNVSLVFGMEELAYLSARAASLGATILKLSDAKLLSATFQYHIVDMHCSVPEFEGWYSRARYMADHWNDAPHRLGLFDWAGNPRPQYFLYQLLYSVYGERFKVEVSYPDYLHSVAAQNENGDINVFISNFNNNDAKDIITKIKMKSNPIGLYDIKVYRIDDDKRWTNDLTLHPVEERTTYMPEDFDIPIYAPANSVVLVNIKKHK